MPTHHQHHLTHLRRSEASHTTSPIHEPIRGAMSRLTHHQQQSASHTAPKDTSRVFVCSPSRPGVVLAVPRERVLHVPAKPADNSRLTLCPAFDVADPSGARCEAGSACGFVHADVRGAEVQVAHERVASWRSLADVPYPQHEPGRTVYVTREEDRSSATFDPVPTENLLVTQAFQRADAACERHGYSRVHLRHCVHFVTKGICHRGSECSFAHVVDLPAAILQEEEEGDAPAVAALSRFPTMVANEGLVSWDSAIVVVERALGDGSAPTRSDGPRTHAPAATAALLPIARARRAAESLMLSLVSYEPAVTTNSWLSGCSMSTAATSSVNGGVKPAAAGASRRSSGGSPFSQQQLGVTWSSSASQGRCYVRRNPYAAQPVAASSQH